MDAATPRHPANEAWHALREHAPELAATPGLALHVLEPSPPAVRTEPFADDPATPTGAPALTPTTAGSHHWDDVASTHAALAPFAARHWLGAWKPLLPLPDELVTTRRSLHAVAFYVVSSVRRAANGKIGLRWTRGGFGTPWFVRGDGDMQVRVEDGRIVAQDARGVRHEALHTMRRAGELAQHEPDPLARGHFDVAPMPDLDQPLEVDVDSAQFLGEWFGFATSVLEQLRVDARAGTPSLVQLWPEHFDCAIDAGGAVDAGSAGGARASFGCSPGDHAHPAPYVYVAPWEPVDRGDPFWNDTAFNGAALGYEELLASADPRAAALAFLRDGLARLSRPSPR